MNQGSDLQSLLKQAAKNLHAIDEMANYLYRNRQPLEPVLEAYRKYLEHKPDSPTAAYNYAYYLSKDGRFEEAVDLYRQALQLGIDAPEQVHLNVANIFMDYLHKPDEARAILQKSLSIKPDYASAWYNLGNLSEQGGDRLEAQRCFELCLKYDPSFDSALARLADAHIFENVDDPLIGRLAGVAQHSRNSDVFFALGRAYEQVAEFDLAWSHFTKGNQLDSKAMPAYDQAFAESFFLRVAAQCSRQWLRAFQGESDQAVFICGMFRSGSTLLEQVLAAHPAFIAGGESQFFPRLVAREFPDYPEGLDRMSVAGAVNWKRQLGKKTVELFGAATRVTDKRPDNFLHIGLIKAVLPSAKFLVMERDWRDIAASVYSTRLGAGQNYATSLADTRHYIGLQEKLVDHWQTILGPDLLRVRYEDLVTDPRSTITAVLNALGENWDERCMSFNRLRNAVRTASVWQVREPMHTKSVGRWQHYRQYFEKTFGAGNLSSEP